MPVWELRSYQHKEKNDYNDCYKNAEQCGEKEYHFNPPVVIDEILP